MAALGGFLAAVGGWMWRAMTACARPALIKAIWTEDESLTAPLSPEVAHYAGQAELARAIQEGLQARRDQDETQATLNLGRAVQPAARSGNYAMSGLQAGVVEVI